MVTTQQKKDGGAGKNVRFSRETDTPAEDLPSNIIQRYSEWASTLTDAPSQYHRVLGAMILSSIISPHISLDTSYGPIRPNLWCMILAGSTLTRKSTCMNIATKMLSDIDDDFLLATDGSPEGIFQELSNRSGETSLFHRDEITGFMAAISSRDYLSGLLESFTHLYDGVEQKRVLRSTTVVVKDPFFLFLCGGIKSKMEELINMDHIRSGFLPRFIIVSGTTSPNQIRPIGPPSKEELKTDGTSPRDLVFNDLWRIYKFFHDPPPNPNASAGLSVKVSGTVVKAPPTSAVPLHHKMEATPDSWTRIQQLHSDATILSATRSAPDLYGPLYARLADSVVKVAILLAASELRTEIHLRDLEAAILLGDEWLGYLNDFALAIEQQPDRNPWEKKIDTIFTWMKSQWPHPLTQTEIMQKKRIRSKDIVDIRNTMEERGLIRAYSEVVSGNARNLKDGKKWYWELKNPPTSNNKARNAIEREGQFRT